MGWNTLRIARDHALLAGIPTEGRVLHAYFVHSFALAAERPEDVVPRPITAVPSPQWSPAAMSPAQQFHPEKSQRLGLARSSRNFLTWRP